MNSLKLVAHPPPLAELLVILTLTLLLYSLLKPLDWDEFRWRAAVTVFVMLLILHLLVHVSFVNALYLVDPDLRSRVWGIMSSVYYLFIFFNKRRWVRSILLSLVVGAIIFLAAFFFGA